LGVAQGYLARKKREGVPLRVRLGFFDEKLGAAALDDLAVIVSIQVRLRTPRHLVIIFPNDVLRIGKSRIAREGGVTPQIKEIFYPSRTPSQEIALIIPSMICCDARQRSSVRLRRSISFSKWSTRYTIASFWQPLSLLAFAKPESSSFPSTAI